MDESTVEVYLRVKSCCDYLVQNPKKDNVYRFVEIITNNSHVAMQYLSKYCLNSTIISLQIKDLR